MKIKTYLMLSKPGIILGNVITMAGGFALASQGHMDGILFLLTLLGLSLLIASACVFNNYIDREIDQKMERTKNRALAKGTLPIQNALIVGALFGIAGLAILGFFTNLIAALVGFLGFLVYVFVYSFLKYKSTLGTVVGSISGGVPPLVGYCAVKGQLDLCGILIFLIVVFWQMPHFFAIAIYRFNDYAKASIPVLPVVKGMHQTKVQMLLYIIGFIALSLTLSLLGYVGSLYLIITAIFGMIWLKLCIDGFKSLNDQVWAKKMFFFSLAMITALSIMIPIDIIDPKLLEI